ncbi:MAG: hypothetical protein WAV93_05155 [Bacteroidales bacterium]
MFEREPNIDIVFRNGLKNMEVLPPADVWDNIPPMPVRRTRLRVITGIAAGIAALVSLTLLAGWLLRGNNTGNRLAELTLPISEPQAVRTDRTVSTPVTENENLPASAVATTPSTGNRTSEKTLIMPAEEPMRLLAGAEMNLQAGPGDRSLPVSTEDVTVIASGKLTGAAEDKELTLTPVTREATSRRFLVGASMSPTMGFSAGAQDMRLSELMNGEKSRPSLTTGLTFGYKISDRLTIQSGIGLASIGQTITGVDVFAGLSDFYAVKSSYLYSVETASGMLLAGNTDLYLSDNGERVGTRVQGADPSKYQLTQVGDDIQQVFRYLELPLMLRYKVIDSKVGLNLSGGLAYGFLVDNTAYTGQGSEMVRVGHTEGINTHNLSSQLGLGMEYNISSKISFNLEPVFKYYVTPISDLSGTFYKPYSLGIWSGFYFKF